MGSGSDDPAAAPPPGPVLERRVVARNPSADSENRIHADDVARRHGFQGGLVPGVTVYGYVADFLVEAGGASWVGGGRAEVRFRSPCYDGEDLVIRLSPSGSPPDPAGTEWGIEVATPAGVAVTGTAGTAPPGPLSDPVPAAAIRPAGDRPEVSAGELVPGTVLGTIELDTGAGAVAAYAARIGARPGLLDGRGWVHPGLLLDAANRVLMAHVAMPLWLHVGSSIHHRRPVAVGEPVEVRARVAREWESKGHRFVTLDVAWVSPARSDPVAEASHTAIWHLSGSG